MCAIICKAVNRKKLKNKDEEVFRENLLGALTNKVLNPKFAVLQQEIREMQAKFGNYIITSNTSVYDYKKVFKDHLPGYKEYMNVKVTQDYAEDDVRILHCVLEPDVTEFELLLEANKLYHKHGKENDSKYASKILEIKVPKKDFDVKYRIQTITLSLDYVVRHPRITYSKGGLLLPTAPRYLNSFLYITNNAKLEMFVNHTKNEEGKYLREFLKKGGLRNDEFVHLGMV